MKKTDRLQHFEGLSVRFETYHRTLQSFVQEVENEIAVLEDNDTEDARMVFKKIHKLIDHVVATAKLKP